MTIHSIPAEVVEDSVVLTIRKFVYIAGLLAVYATQVFRVVSGLTPPKNTEFGRYFQSGDPLLQYQEAATSVDALIAQGVGLREILRENSVTMIETARFGNLATDLAPAIYSLMTDLMNCCATPVDQMGIMSILAGFRPLTRFTGTDAIGGEIAALAARTAVMVRVAALTNLALATASYVPNSSTDAITTRNTVAALLDAEMTRLASWYDDLDYNALKALRTAVVTDLNARANQLKPVVTVNLAANLPSLVVAQYLYGDATREPDLTARNDSPSPGFLPLTLEALAQ